MNMNDRFRYMRREILHKSQQELADILFVSQQIIAFIENGRKKKLDPDILWKIGEKLNINLEWLMFGTGDPIKINKDRYSENIVPVYFYSAKAAAGNGEEAPDVEEKNLLYFDRRWLKNFIGVNPENLSIIQAKGDSMDSGLNRPDDIKDGDLLMVDSSQKEGNNKIFVFRIDNELRVKRLKWELSGALNILSNNAAYPTEIKEFNTLEFMNFEIIGRVVWNGSKECV